MTYAAPPFRKTSHDIVWMLREDYSSEMPAITDLFDSADDALFDSILKNSDHVMQPYLPERTQSQYNLRAKAHSKELITKTAQLTDNDYLVRMLYKNIY